MWASLLRPSLQRRLWRYSSFNRLCSSSSRGRFRVAVIGSGPAGFYFSGSLMRLLGDKCAIDLYDKQPLPFGLVRFGVAPDHPEVKNCTHQFEELFRKSGGHLRFFGNVAVGTDVAMEELTGWYDAVVLACGADAERKLGIPNEWATNCLSARSLVGWYNGHPDSSHIDVSFDTDMAAVIGHGNVALDVARVLLSPLDRLRSTDTPEFVLEALTKNRIERVLLVGRRGPLQVAFTIKELRELVNLPGSTPHMYLNDFDGVESAIETLPRSRKRLIELLLKTAQHSEKFPLDSCKSWSLLFKRTPSQFIVNNDNHVIGVEFALNRLVNADGNVKAIVSGDMDRIDCGLVVKSIGYSTVVIPGVPYDTEKSVIQTTDGVHVTGQSNMYACGWCSRGALGVIATTQLEAKRCASVVESDVSSGKLQPKSNDDGREQSYWETLLSERGVRWASWQDWLRIDQSEIDQGKKKGKPREKLTSVNDILRLVNGSNRPKSSFTKADDP